MAAAVEVSAVSAAKSGSRDISVRKVNLSVCGKDLLVDAEVRLSHGRHYGLVGPNGVGKSTLLLQLAARRIDGIPAHLRIVHVAQFQLREAEASQSVLETVVRSDTARTSLEDRLAELMERTDDDGGEEEADIIEQLDMMDSEPAEARARRILSGLLFTQKMQDAPMGQLSGGWRMRVALACALFNEPDLLLLDEPTNHLDIHAIMWLQQFLSQFKRTVVVVSHDREFLNSVAHEIIHFTNERLKYYPGDFRSFRHRQHETLLSQQRRQKQNEAERQRLLSSIEKMKQNARGRDQRASLGGVRSRRIALDKLNGPQLMDGGYWKLFDMAWAWGFEAICISPEQVDPEYRFRLPDAPPLRSTGPLIQFRRASFSFPGAAKPVLSDITLDIEPTSRISIIGRNGAGKTTLLDLLCRVTKPSSGEVYWAPGLQVAYYSQHATETLDDDETTLAYLDQRFPGNNEQTLRGHLGAFGLGGRPALQKIKTLSGGQRARLILALLAWNEPHVLVLDEPTNHFDFESIDALIVALQSYTGAVVVVSHDRHFVDSVAEDLYLVARGNCKRFDGSVEDYAMGNSKV